MQFNFYTESLKNMGGKKVLKKPRLPRPEEDDSLSAREDESAWSLDSPSIRGMESSEDGTDES